MESIGIQRNDAQRRGEGLNSRDCQTINGNEMGRSEEHDALDNFADGKQPGMGGCGDWP